MMREDNLEKLVKWFSRQHQGAGTHLSPLKQWKFSVRGSEQKTPLYFCVRQYRVLDADMRPCLAGAGG